ncbi:MAG: fenitrothion hydrolase [Actinomycetota bacterium]|nr:fenitrothion hydrolase [Actinomycetota bacterium]
MNPLLAHGIGGVRDLPVPTWLFLYGAGVVLVVSFVALGVLWRRPLLERYRPGRPLPSLVQRIVLSRALRIVAGLLSFGLLVVVALAALLGSRTPAFNLAPTFVYVVFWLGLVPVVVLLGNVWPALNPWKAAADAVSWLAQRLGLELEGGAYPDRLGYWPAAILLALFTALELAYDDPASPRVLALAIFLYSGITWIGALLCGREEWFRRGDGFSVYFGLLSRMAPFAVEEQAGERRVVARPPIVGLASLGAPGPGMLAFVSVMLGSVAFDGLSRTSRWLDWRASFSDAVPGAGDLAAFAFNLAGLVATIALVALAYLLATKTAELVAHAGADLARAFVASLVPIALVYAVSHYFSLLLVQGQFALPLASDPLGRGWDIFGTADFRPDLTPLAPNTVWYFQVGTLVAGHVAGLVLAHDRALSLLGTTRRALRTQYPLLVLMVAYTVGGLWLLSLE